jgi:hypothetical protein
MVTERAERAVVDPQSLEHDVGVVAVKTSAELPPGASRQSRDLTAPVPVRACPAL